MWRLARLVKTAGCCLALVADLACAGTTADPAKVLRVAMEAADDGFDLARTINGYSMRIARGIFEPLLTYDYLARPAKLVPNTIESMPEVADEGKTFTFHLKRGIVFAPDPAFKGRRHELTAADYAYSWKRLMDPANRSPIQSYVEGKIVGLDALAAAAKKSGHFDYDAPVAGIEIPDPYTLRIHLVAPDYNFLYAVAYIGLAAVAREVIDAYGSQTGLHPVGTGPYMLSRYVPRSKIVLVANPEFRGFTWDFQSTGDAWDAQLIRDMKGKTMPRVGRVEVSIIEEDQSRWLAYQDGQLDYDKLPQTATLSALDGTVLKPVLAGKGITLYRVTDPEITFSYINQHDPVLGGASREKIALRRAILMAYDVKLEITQVRLKQAVAANGLVPVGVQGFDPAYRSSLAYDPVLANKLLDHFGYKRRADGYRALPDGKPLVLKIAAQADTTSTIVSEIWKRGLDLIGIRVEFPTQNFADNVKAATQCRLMMWTVAWGAIYPEGENFAQLLYGKSIGQSNLSCYKSAAYDALYEKMQATPPGPARVPLYDRMTQQMEADSVFGTHVSRVRNWLVEPWIKGFKEHPFLSNEWAYVDIEKH